MLRILFILLLLQSFCIHSEEIQKPSYLQITEPITYTLKEKQPNWKKKPLNFIQTVHQRLSYSIHNQKIKLPFLLKRFDLIKMLFRKERQILFILMENHFTMEHPFFLMKAELFKL